MFVIQVIENTGFTTNGQKQFDQLSISFDTFTTYTWAFCKHGHLLSLTTAGFHAYSIFFFQTIAFLEHIKVNGSTKILVVINNEHHFYILINSST